MLIRDLEPKPYGYDVVGLGGKTDTSEPPSLIFDYAKIVRVWLEHHPLRNNPNAPLWIRVRWGKGRISVEPISRTAAHRIIKKAATAAGIKRRFSAHNFRHTAATYCARRVRMTEEELRRAFGWSQNSPMPRIYVHLAKGDTREHYL